MNPGWTPAAILPNLTAKKAIEGETIALAPHDDPRVQALCAAHPNFKEFISRFTDAFAKPLRPMVLIVLDDAAPKLSDVRPLASFRDLVAMCAVPYGRSLASIYPNGGHRLSYSNSFWLYPWMLGTDNKYLVASTPALHGSHLVERFHGQSAPEVPQKNLDDFDDALFQALLPRWKRHYLGQHQRWPDRALFRSLNMAANAALLPAGIDTTLYDLGRVAALWVSAFEILVHPRKGRSDLQTVYALLEGVPYLSIRISRHRYVAYKTDKNSRRPFTCWLYGKLYQARNDFLHGNPVSPKTLTRELEESLFWFAPGLYRMALTGFLGPGLKRKSNNSDSQEAIEEALLRARK